MPAIHESMVEVEGVDVFLRRSEGTGSPTVFVHGNPSSSDDWLPFLDAIEGPAVAFDLPGWGRSGRPAHTYTMHGLAGFIERLLAELAIGRYKLVVHDWGSVGLLAAAGHPERLERLVIINAVPFIPGFRWHWVARQWRRRGIGEFFNAITTRAGTRVLIRQARGDRGPMPEVVDSIHDHLDRGTKRAILTLYRSADPEELEAAGRGFEAIACPALVVWGGRDPYLPARYGRAFAQLLPRAELLELPRLGHWPWVEEESVVGRILDFLGRA